MEKKVKISLSLPVGILAAVEQARRARGMNRNEFMRLVVAGYLLGGESDGENLRRFVGGEGVGQGGRSARQSFR